MASRDAGRLGKDAVRLGQLVVARRVQLGMRTSAALAETANLTVRVISDLESGRRSNFNQSTRAAVEQALKWGTGSIDIALHGGEPRPVPDVAPQELREGLNVDVSSADDESSGAPQEAGPDQVSTVDALNSVTLRQLDVIAGLTPDMSEDDLTRIDRIRHEISSLPTVLAPWLDSPAGMRQYMHRIETLVAGAMDVVESHTGSGSR